MAGGFDRPGFFLRSRLAARSSTPRGGKDLWRTAKEVVLLGTIRDYAFPVFLRVFIYEPKKDRHLFRRGICFSNALTASKGVSGGALRFRQDSVCIPEWEEEEGEGKVTFNSEITLPKSGVGIARFLIHDVLPDVRDVVVSGWNIRLHHRLNVLYT